MPRKLIITSLIVFFVLAALWQAFLFYIEITPPKVDESAFVPSPIHFKRSTKAGENWIRKSESGLYEMYLEGEPYAMGLANGVLAEKLIVKQEIAFVDQLHQLVPSDFYINFLKYMISFFNRALPDHVLPEYQQTIYGISQAASTEYEFIGNNYDRILNYHAAHDMGHALQNMRFVGCTAFGAWGSKTADSSLLIGRNFDFYVGDKFAEDKIICFFKPKQGFKYMTVAWGGFIGACSGMNEKGLTVTLNAAKSEVPLGAATPVSLLGTEILQYASNIKEAYEIAKKRKTFVAESFMIGSAADGKVVVIEKSPSQLDIYDPKGNSIILTNHFQSPTFMKDSLNVQHMRTSASVYRYQKVAEDLKKYKKYTPGIFATILRDTKGKGGKDIGLGNENAINQLICHHSIIFKPEQKKVWVSTAPYQLGKYVCYDLNTIFNLPSTHDTDLEIYDSTLVIPADTFKFSSTFENYQYYRALSDTLKKYTSLKEDILGYNFVKSYTGLNPNLYIPYALAGDYYAEKKENDVAALYYKLALSKNIPTVDEKASFQKKLERVQRTP